jgi:hypothetical protein
MSTQSLHIRASSVPLLLKCGQSIRGEIAVKERAEAAIVGTIVHHLLADYVFPDGTDIAPEELCERHEVDSEEPLRLLAYGRQAWDTLKKKHPVPVVEKQLQITLEDGAGGEPLPEAQRKAGFSRAPNLLTITGTADVLAMTQDECRVVDWKSGRVRSDHWAQLATYGLLGAHAMGVQRATVTLVWLRYGEYETRHLDSEALAYHADQIRAAVASREFVIGEHCTYCPRRATCPAAIAETQHAIEVLTRKPEYVVADLAKAGALPELLRNCTWAAAAAKKAREAVKRYVAEQGEVKQNGQVMYLKETYRRRVLPRAGWNILRDTLGEDLDRAVKVTLGEAQKIVAERSRRGDKGKAKARLMEALEDAGAVEREAYQVLSVKEDK